MCTHDKTYFSTNFSCFLYVHFPQSNVVCKYYITLDTYFGHKEHSTDYRMRHRTITGMTRRYGIEELYLKGRLFI